MYGKKPDSKKKGEPKKTSKRRPKPITQADLDRAARNSARDNISDPRNAGLRKGMPKKPR